MVDSTRFLPTFVGNIPRKMPPRGSTSLRGCSPEADERRVKNQFQYPSQLDARVRVIFDAAGHMREPLATEHEWPLGYPTDVTAEKLPNSQTRGRMQKNAHCALRGTAWQLETLPA